MITKYVKIENDQIVEISLEDRPGYIAHQCVDQTADIFLVDGNLVEGFYNPAEFTAEQIGLFELNDQRYKAREYLISTDWYAARLAETGTPIPADVLEKRQQSRALLSS
jgi:hypothetical protein